MSQVLATVTAGLSETREEPPQAALEPPTPQKVLRMIGQLNPHLSQQSKPRPWEDGILSQDFNPGSVAPEATA